MDSSPGNGKVVRIAFLVLFCCAVTLLFVWQFSFFLLVFASILLAVGFHFVSSWITKKTGMKYGLSLVITLVTMLALFGLFGVLAGPSLNKQLEEISETLPQSVEQLKSKLGAHPIGKKILNQVPDNPEKKVAENKEMVAAAANYLGSFLGMLGNALIVLIAAIFFASSPGIYYRGLLRLIPPTRRPEAKSLIHKLYETLATWLGAKLVSMAVVGVATGVGLALLGVPLALILAFIAAALTFIPYIGPYLALVPAVLVGLLDSPQTALYITILYFGIQMVESYFITPLIEKKMVELPPGLAIFWQVLLGITVGGLGLLLASPILACMMVVVEETYIKRIENKRSGE